MSGSQYDFGTIDDDVVDGDELSDILEAWRDALHSRHRGDTEPDYKVAGMQWIQNISSSIEKVQDYDGSAWIHIYTLDPTDHSVKLADGIVGGDAFTLDVFNDLAEGTFDPAVDEIIYADGSNGGAPRRGLLPATTSGQLLREVIFTADGTWTKQPDMAFIEVEVIGAGGAGGGNNATANASGHGGGAGAWGKKSILAADLGSTEAVDIGVGGLGVNSLAGTDGSATTFGAHISAPGGKGGKQAGAAAPGAGGGHPTGADYGGSGSPGAIAANDGANHHGGAGGGSRNGGSPGPTIVSGNGNSAAANTGGGGSGSWSSTATIRKGGDAGSGICIVREYS